MRRDHPDVQEKVKQAIKQGHIAPEEFKGVSNAHKMQYYRADANVRQDPEYNKPGQKAIRGRATKAKAKKDDEVR